MRYTAENSNPFDVFRATLTPKGTSDLVRLSLSGSAFFHHDFVLSVIDELETKVKMVAAGMDTLTNMDKLVLEVLKESSYWEPPTKD